MLGLPDGSYKLGSNITSRSGISATQFQVEAADSKSHRHFSDISAMIGQSRLDGAVKARALAVFQKLAEAEAKVHGVPVDHVHFHEVGAIDSIVDIVGTAIALCHLGVEEIVSAPLPYGSGWVNSEHGKLPVPAPATAELMKGLPVIPDPVPGEWVTPTGASIVAALCTRCGTIPSMTITSTGYGAGTKECHDRPNLLRAVLGETDLKSENSILVMETNIDDMNPEIAGFLMDRLFEAGALDVTFSPLQMKKNRPGSRLAVITDHNHLDELSRMILTESTAIGLRYYPVKRVTLQRSSIVIETSLGPVRAKKVLLPDGSCRISPEFEECRRIAVEKEIPILDVYRLIEREKA
jgi:uncharacterized protein (TIGR00299 family) protein